VSIKRKIINTTEEGEEKGSGKPKGLLEAKRENEPKN